MRTSDSIGLHSRPKEAPHSGFRVNDVYYLLFRHKWKILVCTVLGLGLAAAALLTLKPNYVSRAKILVRYVVDTREVATADGTSIRTPDSRGENIMSTEIDLLTSLNLAKKVVNEVGATNIAIGRTGTEAVSEALGAVSSGIRAEAQRRSSTLLITYEHRDPEVTRRVFTNLIAAYQRTHIEVHSSADVLSDASKQVEIRRNSLSTIENELRRLKNELGILSLDEAKQSALDQLSRINNDVLNAEALLSEHRAVLGVATNAPQTASAATATNTPTPPAPAPVVIPPNKLSEYRRVITQIDALNRREAELLVQFKPESAFVRAVRDLLKEQETQRQTLETDFPDLPNALAGASARTAAALPSSAGFVNPAAEAAAHTATTIRSIEAKLSTLRLQQAQVQTNLLRINASEALISDLERRKSIEEKQYAYHYNALEQARVDEALSTDKISGLSVVESPTPPVADRARIMKIAAGLAGGGLALGIALALALEFFIDQTIRRPVQVERNLKLPLYLSVPRLDLPKDGSSLPKLLAAPPTVDVSDPDAGKDAAAQGASPDADGHEIATATDPLGEYAEALRDRLMMHFQLNGLNHKPKLVGVTSCGHQAGVTSIATQLAASLSETGDGNVLYVDVNRDKGPSAHPFRRGKLLAGIRDALEEDTRASAKVQDNLYMVSLTDASSGKVGIIPKTLAGLVPKMKASDYDYIIFDLPPVTQTSATSKVAGLLDMTFVVLEAEKTQSDLAKKAIELLGESRANVAAVLNKHDRYLPKKLDTDL